MPLQQLQQGVDDSMRVAGSTLPPFPATVAASLDLSGVNRNSKTQV